MTHVGGPPAIGVKTTLRQNSSSKARSFGDPVYVRRTLSGAKAQEKSVELMRAELTSRSPGQPETAANVPQTGSVRNTQESPATRAWPVEVRRFTLITHSATGVCGAETWSGNACASIVMRSSAGFGSTAATGRAKRAKRRVARIAPAAARLLRVKGALGVAMVVAMVVGSSTLLGPRP
jgi:hypothetical protein